MQYNNFVPILWMEGTADILAGGMQEMYMLSISFSQEELKTSELLLARFHPVPPVPSRIQGPQIFIP